MLDTRERGGLAPDAVIAIAPRGQCLEDLRDYYRALRDDPPEAGFCPDQRRPRGLEPSMEFFVELARIPAFRLREGGAGPAAYEGLAKFRPAIKTIFSGTGGWPYEMRLGFDGMMPGSPYADIYASYGSCMRPGRRTR